MARPEGSNNCAIEDTEAEASNHEEATSSSHKQLEWDFRAALYYFSGYVANTTVDLAVLQEH